MEKNKIWATFCNMKFKGFILGFLIQKYQILDRNINIFLAITSSGSIAAWALWQDNPFIWGLIIASSQVVMAIKPLFPYNKMVKELNSRNFKMEFLNIDFEDFWNKAYRKKLKEDEQQEKYFQFNKLYAEVLNFPDNMVVTASRSIERKADQKMKNFLKTFYGINISIT